MKKNLITAARSPAFGLFRDKETDWTFRRTLEFMGEKCAEIGECLDVARKIDERDGNSWIFEWTDLADRVMKHGATSLEEGHTASARECFLRAANYYRTAEYGTPPSHSRFEPLWKASVDSFGRAAALFSPPIQSLEIPVDGRSFAAYYWPAKVYEPGETGRPTLIAAGGNDSSLEEVVMWTGMAAARRGYNFFTFDHPGHRGALHRYPDCIKRPDYETSYKTAIDFLEKLPGVDDRLAMTGYSFGGYVTCRVAAHEKRLKAIAPNSPIIDLLEASVAFKGNILDFVQKLPPFMINAMGKSARRRMKKTPVLLAFQEYTDWTAGMNGSGISFAERLNVGIDFLKEFRVNGDLGNITVPALAMVGSGDGDALIEQARRFIDGVSSKEKRLHLFTMAQDGSDDHCQLDNRSRGAQVMFDFFDDVFDFRER